MSVAVKCYRRVVKLTPSDSTDLVDSPCIALMTDTAGTVKITTAAGDVVTGFPLAAGVVVQVAAKRVWSTGKTAGNIFALYAL